MKYKIYVDDYCIHWSKNGYFHRLDGPAFLYTNGGKLWHKNHKYHREDGPAREYVTGTKEWWIDGHLYSEEEFKRIQAGKT